MSELKRYSFWPQIVHLPGGGGVRAEVHFKVEEDGLFVAHQDYARLQAEVERLTDENVTLRMERMQDEKGKRITYADYAVLKAEVERLRAASFVTAVPVEQYERLRKAGDAMEIALQADFNGCPYEPLVIMQAIRRWRTAKEGKQP